VPNQPKDHGEKYSENIVEEKLGRNIGAGNMGNMGNMKWKWK
jgi:hypothetical protein